MLLNSQLGIKNKPFDNSTWTLVVIPDTQRLAANNPTAMNNMAQWIVDNKDTEDIRMVMHLGDYCNLGSSSTEWSRVDTAWNRLHGEVPFVHCAGNHDYDDDAKGSYSRKETFWDATFPESDWTGYDWYIDSYNSITTNMAAKLQIGQYSYLFLTLEFHPRQAAMDWAQSVIDNNPTDRIILTTHTLTDPEARYAGEDRPVDGTGQAGQPQYYGVCNFSTDADCKTGQEIYDELISRNPNIILACSGHDVVGSAPDSINGVPGQSAFSKRVDVVGGNNVNVHLFNYQNASASTYANSAYFRIYRFSHDGKTCSVETYNPVQDTNHTDSENQFTMTYS